MGAKTNSEIMTSLANKRYEALSLSSALLCLSCHTITLLCCAVVLQTPSSLSWYISLYSIGAGLASAVGAIGIFRKQTLLIRRFAIFLLVDAYLGTIARMLIAELLVAALNDADVCANLFAIRDDSTFNAIQQSFVVSLGGKLNGLFERTDDCQLTLALGHSATVTSIAFVSTIQTWLMIVLRWHANGLERTEQARWAVGDQKPGVQSHLAEKTSFVDQCDV